MICRNIAMRRYNRWDCDTGVITNESDQCKWLTWDLDLDTLVDREGNQNLGATSH